LVQEGATASDEVILNELYALCPDQRANIDAEIKANLAIRTPLQKFLFIYSTNYVYKQVNRAITNKEYTRLMNICKLVWQAFTQNAVVNVSQLYRGIDFDSKGRYSEGLDGFWPGFTSTTKTLDVASDFGKHNTIMHIQLDPKNPYPHVDISKLSAYPKEQEILILPFFPLIVDKTSVDAQGRFHVYVKQNPKVQWEVGSKPPIPTLLISILPPPNPPRVQIDGRERSEICNCYKPPECLLI